MKDRIEVLKAVIAAWRAGDIEAALSHMTDDIVWRHAASLAPPLHGKSKARQFLERFQDNFDEVQWQVRDHIESGDRLFVEGVDEYATEDGALITAPYAGVLEFRGPLIHSWSDYLDVGVAEARKLGQPATAWVRTPIERAAL
ncbi:MAG: nuclear transport factor 2 family protein [Caulobacteraceae bacterium]|nr:nuclear transport factor 2 family protein [Caulobacteraceae bacterium]